MLNSILLVEDALDLSMLADVADTWSFFNRQNLL
jgi:hypothetical protein